MKFLFYPKKSDSDPLHCLEKLFFCFEERWIVMLGVCLVKIFDVDFDAFAGESIYLVFLDDFLGYRQGDGENICDLVYGPIGLNHK